MAIEIAATEATAAGPVLGVKPIAILAGAKAFALAHPLGILGLVGGSLVLIGLSDAVQGYRAKKRAAADSPAAPDQTASSW